VQHSPDPSGVQVLDDAIQALCSHYGFDYYLLASFPQADKSGFGDNLLVCNWPGELINVYRKADGFRVSKIIARLKRAVMPVFMQASSFWLDADNRETPELAQSFTSLGFENVLAFTLHDAEMNMYVIALCGSVRSPAMSDIMAIYFAAMQALDNGTALSALQAGPREKLTAREVECLRWSAAGKSSDEIAIILAISSHTVISYLKSAMRKLEAVNRMQAVARAYRYRLL
jgi:DNA-binding CsgD family transcriptional regulator